MTAAAGSGRPAYRRIVLKLSGEALAGSQGYGIDPLVLDRVASEVRDVPARGLQVEIGADAIMKATQVDGIYSADPKRDASAQRLERMTYIEVLNRGLQVMDAAAISLCMENKLPIIVFDLARAGNIKRIVLGEVVGSIVSSGG